MRANRLVTAVLVASTTAFALAGCSSGPPPKSQASPLLSRLMPSFSGETLTNNDFVSEQGDGHKMIVKFFSTSCDRCADTLAAVQRIQSDDSSVVVVGIAEDDSETETRRFVSQRGVHFPILLDKKGSLAREYHVANVPTTFVITAKGSVAWVGGPDQTEDGIRSALASATD